MNYKHGLTKHLLYQVWRSMKKRCYNSKDKGYKNYGGRGITVCDEWVNNPKIFIEWCIKNGWEKGLEVDRENNNKGYSPDNCRFVTHAVNNRNTQLLRSNNKSGYRGVSWSKHAKKWYVQISINNKDKNLGYFINKIDAALKYNDFARELNDGRPLNFI